MELLAQLLPFVFLIAIMYFIIIRPQQQQAKRHQEMITNLQKGDKIVTSGGLIVEIKKVETAFFLVKISDEMTAKLDKQSVARKFEDEA